MFIRILLIIQISTHTHTSTYTHSLNNPSSSPPFSPPSHILQPRVVLDRRSAVFVVDPENNLPATQGVFILRHLDHIIDHIRPASYIHRHARSHNHPLTHSLIHSFTHPPTRPSTHPHSVISSHSLLVQIACGRSWTACRAGQARGGQFLTLPRAAKQSARKISSSTAATAPARNTFR